MKPRLVLVLNHYALPRSQGGGTRHVEMFGQLTGWETLIVATSRHHTTQDVFRTDDPRFRLVSTPHYTNNGAARVLGWLVYAVQAVMIGLTVRRPSAVYASSPHLLALVAGAVVATFRRAPLIVEIRDLWPESMVSAGLMAAGSPLHRVLSTVERFAYQRADHIVAVTSGWDAYFASLGVPKDRITVVPNGCDTSDFAVSQSRAELRKAWGITGTTAVFAGSHGPKDGIDLVLDAACEVPHVQFLLVGSGSAKTPAMARVAKDGLMNVRFESLIPKSELAQLLHACDIGLHAVAPLTVFDHGMSPNKLFDYLASGLPVASNARTPLAAVLDDDQCGRLGAAAELGQCVRDVADAPDDVRRRWQDAGRQLVDERFSRAAAARKLEVVLEALVVQSARRRRKWRSAR